jgi:hypothetical protein
MGDYIIRNGELYHWGVLGMKWGVRRYQNKDGSLTALGKERAKILKSDGADKISDKDNLKIEKGSALYRISTKARDEGDTRYLSYRTNDRNFYKGYWGNQLRENKPNAELYEQTYKATSDVFIPSAKTRRKILSNLLNDDDVIRSICRDESGSTNVYLENNLRSTSSRWSESTRANYLSKWMGHRPDVLAKYGKEIVSRGFNAVVDDGGRSVGEMPIILFTPNASLLRQNANKVDSICEKIAQREYSDIDAKKYRDKTASI